MLAVMVVALNVFVSHDPTQERLLSKLTCSSTLFLFLLHTSLHLRSKISKNDIDILLASWGSPGSPTADQARWPTDFSRDITPIPCQSHNDHWYRVPLYNALVRRVYCRGSRHMDEQ